MDGIRHAIVRFELMVRRPRGSLGCVGRFVRQVRTAWRAAATTFGATMNMQLS